MRVNARNVSIMHCWFAPVSYVRSMTTSHAASSASTSPCASSPAATRLRRLSAPQSGTSARQSASGWMSVSLSIACAASRIAGSTRYLTRMSRIAASACRSVCAATMATGSPTQRR